MIHRPGASPRGTGGRLAFLVRNGAVSTPLRGREPSQEGTTTRSRPAGAAAHHIAAESARLADRARQILARFNIDINGAANGIFLDAAQHARIHPHAYYQAVNRMLSQATTRAEALAVLDRIRALIAAGKFPSP
jgi:hypothetical protein